MFRVLFFTILTTCLSSNISFAQTDLRIHDEIESTGGHSLGLGQGGMAAVTDVSSVRMNPAMLAIEPTYSVYGSYHWPTFGREFYQAGVIDSRTSSMAAGLIYTGFDQDFSLLEYDEQRGKESTVAKRLGVGIAQVVGKVSVGLSVFFVEGFDVNESTLAEPEKKKATTFGLGIAGFITPTLKFGVSGENLGGGKLPSIAPKFVRAGLAYLFGEGNTTLHLDYVNRQRIEGVEYGFIQDQNVFSTGYAATSADKTNADVVTTEKNEQMLIGSFSVRVYDMLRLLGSYGQDIDTDRKSASAGVALISKQYSLSYSTSRPYLDRESSHQALNIGFQISL